MATQKNEKNPKTVIDAAFVLPVIYCSFSKYTHSNKLCRLFVLNLRYDNSIGLIGGTIEKEKNESPISALVREADEEASLVIDPKNLSLRYLGMFSEQTHNSIINSHLYTINLGQMDQAGVKNFLAERVKAKCAIIEGTVIITHAYGKYYENLKNNALLALGVKRELDAVSSEYPEFIESNIYI